MACLLGAPFLQAQYGRPSQRGRVVPEVETLTAEQAQQLLQQFRLARLTGDFSFSFYLSSHGDELNETTYYGQLWGTWTEFGPRFRVLIDTQEGETDFKPLSLLVQSGPHPLAWVYKDGSTTRLDEQQFRAPLLPGVQYSAFDLAMGFAHWENTTYIEGKRVRGRPAAVYYATPPSAFMVGETQLSYVEMAVDMEFLALLRARFYDADGQRLRAFEIKGFKKVDDQWIVKAIDLIDYAKDIKTTFYVRSAAVGLQLQESFFHPDNLDDEPPVIDGSSYMN